MKTDSLGQGLWVRVLTVCWSITSAGAQNLPEFDTFTLTPPFELNGSGSDVDSIAFWETPDPRETRLFVTGKANDLLEVWRHPFNDNELDAVEFPANVNGVVVDQETNLLYVSDRIVSVLSLPELDRMTEFGEGIIGVGENNLDILKHADGRTLIYVSDDHNVHRFDASTLAHLDSFAPPVSSIETILADDFHQWILVPEEQGPEGNPGVFVYHPDGSPLERNGSNRFGESGVFDSDEEGILLYTFPMSGVGDNGEGFIVIADQRDDISEFEFFDRVTWAHLGTMRLEGVSNTDGIASTQRALPGYPLGLFAAIDDDSTTACIGWREIFAGIGWDLAPEAVSISPTSAAPSDGTLEFGVVFSEPVTGFDHREDLVVIHEGIAMAGVEVTGEGPAYAVKLTGISGTGSVTLAVATASDVRDLGGKPLASSVTSIPVPVSVGTSYDTWASANGLTQAIGNAFEDDPDRDGSPNLHEFALNGNPLTGGEPVKARVSIAAVDGTPYLTYTVPARTGANFVDTEGRLEATVDGVVYALGGSFDLDDFDQLPAETAVLQSPALPHLDSGWSYRSFRLDAPVGPEFPKGFLRLSVSAIQP